MSLRNRFIVSVVLAMFIIIYGITAHAAVPRTISYQGYLTDASGAPVNGQVQMQFSLYSSASGTVPIWTEVQQSVTVVSGKYSVVLGNVTPIVLTFDAEYHVGVAINGDPEMSPRNALTSVPYAIRALRAGCNPGDMMSCYTANIATLGVSYCKAGVRTCYADGTDFGSCAGEITPVAEVCYDGMDNDCDGQIDNGCPVLFCTPNSSAVCYDGPPATLNVGACTAGNKTCNQEGSAYGPCVGEVLPQTEVCDNMDNNCDGIVDEGNPGGGAVCSGQCGEGTLSCQQGTLVCTCPPPACGNCDDGIACTIDNCNAGTGQCEHTPINAMCDDGNACNGFEICDMGIGCMPGNPLNCDDSSPCTADSCHPAVGCQFENLPDGTFCGSGLTCQAGACIP